MSVALCIGPFQQCDTTTKPCNARRQSCSSLVGQPATPVAEDLQHHMLTANCRYGADGWEVVFGYDQEKMMGDRAGAALLKDLKDVDQKQCTPAMSMT